MRANLKVRASGILAYDPPGAVADPLASRRIEHGSPWVWWESGEAPANPAVPPDRTVFVELDPYGAEPALRRLLDRSFKARTSCADKDTSTKGCWTRLKGADEIARIRVAFEHIEEVISVIRQSLADAEQEYPPAARMADKLLLSELP